MNDDQKFELIIGSFQAASWKNQDSEKERQFADALTEVKVSVMSQSYVMLSVVK